MYNGFKSSSPAHIKLQQPYLDCLALLCLALLVIALHHSALWGSWRWDDGMHLLHVTQYPWSSVFFDPEVMRSVSGNQFAPWNLFLYYVNGALFGAKVHWYYAHHLLSFWSAAGGLYVLLRQWLPAHRAWVTPALLLTGVPTAQMAQQLMVGHYIDGLMFVSVGLALQIRAVNAWGTANGKALAMSLVGALLYGLACLCKEIYVPWILMWLVVPRVFVPSARRLAVCAAPALVVALAYALARLQLFDGLGGYYGGGESSWDAAIVMHSLTSIPGVLFGDGVRGWVAIALMCAASYAGILRSCAWGVVCASAVVVALFPLVILASGDPPWALHARYLWAPWILVCLVWAVPWRGMLRRAQWFACLLFATLVIWQVTILRPDDQQREALFDAHSRLILQPTSEVTHWVPAEFNGASYVMFVTYAAHEALRRLGHTVSSPPKILRAIASDPAGQAAVQVWDAMCNCFRSFLSLTTDERQAALARVQSEKGLLLPGIHPLADAYQGPTPEMRVEGSQLFVSGMVKSEGAGHVLILAGWAPARLVASAVSVQARLDTPATKDMKFEVVLEAQDAAAARQIRDRLCVLMQSQAHPYTFMALDAAAPSSPCRSLLTPLGLRQPPGDLP